MVAGKHINPVREIMEKRERMNTGNNHKHQNGEPFLEQNYHDGPLFLTV